MDGQGRHVHHLVAPIVHHLGVRLDEFGILVLSAVFVSAAANSKFISNERYPRLSAGLAVAAASLSIYVAHFACAFLLAADLYR